MKHNLTEEAVSSMALWKSGKSGTTDLSGYCPIIKIDGRSVTRKASIMTHVIAF